jgi:TIR domain
VTQQGPKYFFSYARTDGDFVLRLAKELRAAGANVWVDQLDIVGGERWDKAVEAALHDCQGTVVVLSPDAVASNNVMDEVSCALEENKLVVPVLRANCEVPFRLRRVQRVDFTTNFDTGLAELLRALKVDKPASAGTAAAADRVERAATAPPATGRVEQAPAQRTASEKRGLAAGRSLAGFFRAAPGPEAATRRRSTLIGFALGAACGLIWTVLYYDARSRPLEIEVVGIFSVVDAVAGAIAGRLAAGRKLPALLAVIAAVGIVAVGLMTVGNDRDLGEVLLGYVLPVAAILGALAGAGLHRLRARA